MEAVVENLMVQLPHISPWIICIIFFISAILQITFPPYPGDTILIFGGYLGSLGINSQNMIILVSYLIGTLLSSYALYVLGAKNGESVLKIKLISKYFPKNHQDRAKKCLVKYGIIIFFICKFIPGLNSITIILGGVFKYNPLWAYLGVGLASLLHNVLFFFIGRSIGYNITNIKKFLSTYNIVVIILIVICIGVYFAYKYTKKKKSEKEALQDSN